MMTPAHWLILADAAKALAGLKESKPEWRASGWRVIEELTVGSNVQSAVLTKPFMHGVLVAWAPVIGSNHEGWRFAHPTLMTFVPKKEDTNE